MAKKQVRLSNYEGLQYDPAYTVPWSDTWVRFKLKRKTIRLGPTLLSLPDLENDHALFGQDPEKHSWYAAPKYPQGEWRFCLPYGVTKEDEDIPTIAVNARFINKALVEDAIAWYLGETYGVTSEINFRWKNSNRKSRCFVTPVTFGPWGDTNEDAGELSA